ncbi:sigma-54 dependent transcriptional regulator [Minwuia sp. IMCC3060]|uniref:sigma-54-dependent transcriptional regulator FlbD n=1 Tax=Minwuia sp. IMCC3060 TaxID=3040675 RepID=UPI00247AC7A4|nr:sigma-54 dependent transcriptional regulator [Minwuia sp. IMCC3060]
MRLLIVGPLSGQFGAASKIAIQNGAKVAHVNTVSDALVQLRAGRGADLAMVDVKLDIGDFVTQLISEHINLEVVACGVGNDTDAAVRAIKGGAKEYVPLPPDPELIAAVLKAVADDDTDLLFRDQRMHAVMKLADQIAPSNACIMITGESGTGKEVMARHIHQKGRRSDKAFVAVNCAAIPDNLLESELFGHEKGAFTGAVTRRVGKFEEADGGTLLLDEISEMDIRLQAKLLRAIQEREIDRVGGSKPVKVDIRVIATSNRDLVEEVRQGNFREDLLYRLNVVNLVLPPLRERLEDVALLADHFVRKYADANAVPPRPLSAGALAVLKRHAWPGNVRELENTMHRAVLLATEDEIEEMAIVLPDGSRPAATQSPVAVVAAATGGAAVSSLPVEGEDAEAANLVGRTVAEVERQLILETLDHCLGNRTHAANILGISIRTLRNKLKAYTEEGIPVPGPGEMRRYAV